MKPTYKGRIVTTYNHISPEMARTINEPISEAISFSHIQGLLFVKLSETQLWTIYNPSLNQAAKTRWVSLQMARDFAINKLCTREAK